MAIKAENSRLTITLPTVLVEQLKIRQGPAQTFSDVIRMRLAQESHEDAARGIDVMQKIERMHEDIRTLYSLLDRIIKTLEMMPAPEPDPPKEGAALPIVSYDEMYRVPDVPDVSSVPVESPQEPKRWWHR